MDKLGSVDISVGVKGCRCFSKNSSFQRQIAEKGPFGQVLGRSKLLFRLTSFVSFWLRKCRIVQCVQLTDIPMH